MNVLYGYETRARHRAACMTTPADTLRRLRKGELAGIRQLDLAGLGLEEFPDEILGLADTLERLDLGGNRLRSLPHALSRLGRLRILFCSGNRFRVLPEALGDCASLAQIGCRGSGIETVPEAALPWTLRWLTLTDNRIATLPTAIGERPRLRKLLLSGNRLAALPGSLADLRSLELLRIAANRVETLPAFVARLPRLAWLGFAGNPAEGTIEGAIPPPVAPASAIEIGALIGEGSSGRIHRACWHRDDGAETVALKVFKGSVTSDGLPAREIDAALAAGWHPRNLGGLAMVPDHPSGAPGLLLPLVAPSWRVLAGPPDLETCSRDVYDPSLRLAGEAVLRIARGIAEAGAHLHGRALLHGDLYAHNVLWDGAAGDAMLGDFGAASIRPAGPEGDALAKLDVLAWAILARELLARTDAPDARLRAAADQASDADPSARPSLAAITRLLAP